MRAPGLWIQARRLAEQTPEARNRYVDLLRALSITVVVLGHWIMAAPVLEGGVPRVEHLLDTVPWSRWLTWLFQVMPVFFFVGGYSNGTSWDGARKRGESYAKWLESRMRRLLGPVVPLIVLWALFGAIGAGLGIDPGMIRIGSQVALIPVWFLAIYLLIVMLVPVTRVAWHRLGVWSVVAPIALATINDVVFFTTEARWLGWLNYLFVWSAVHQIGYAWQQGLLRGTARLAGLFCLGGVVLLGLTQLGPYPTSLVGVPSQAISNTTPPKLPIVALACAQVGMLLLLEAAARRWLARPAVWTATVLMNGMIMTIFLWHSTVMMLMIGAGFWLWPEVFTAVPGSGAWWALRPVWVLAFGLGALPFLAIFLRVERAIADGAGKTVPLWRSLSGAVMLGGGLALLALHGVVGKGPLGLDWWAVGLPVVGGAVAGFGPFAMWRAKPA